nr:reverse transcriptase domain-containing protein [Tanacetum cinerariifolium]
HNQEPPPQNGPPPLVRPNGQAPRTMKELCQPSINGRGRPIATIPIQATDFGLLTQIDTFYNGLTLSHRDTINAAAGETFMQKTLEECYELIENMTAHHNHYDTSTIQDETSRNISSTSTAGSPEVVRQLEMMNKNFSEMMRQFQTVKVVDTKCETCGGPHSFTKCLAVGGYTQETAYATMGNYNSGGRGSNFNQAQTYQAPTHEPQVVPQLSDFQAYMKANNDPSPASTSFSTISSSKMPKVTKDMVQTEYQKHSTFGGPSSKPVVASKPKSTIPYPLRVNKQKLREKDDNLALKFVEISRNLHFELSFADAFSHMPKFALLFKRLLNNKEKLFDLATTPVNKNCSAVILKKLPEKLGDPDKSGRALIDVYGEELTLHVDDEAITFKIGQTSKYSYNDVESINRIDFINVACEEYVQEGIDDTNFDLEGDIRLLEELLNKDPSSSPLPPKELDVEEIKTVKSSIDEPPKLELKELSSHLEYEFLEGTDKLPVIIFKEIKDEEKSTLLEVLKSYKRAIAWKISDIKAIDPRFCTHKILIEDDFKPMVEHQRRVNLKFMKLSNSLMQD